MTFSFASGLWLLLVALALGVVALWEASRRHTRLKLLGDIGLLQSQSAGTSEPVRLASRFCAVASVAFLAVAISGPQVGETSELLPHRGLDLVFAVDVSQSMRARDVRPDRLERVKAEIAATIGRFGENRVALIAFAGTAFVQCPLTTDIEAVRSFLAALDPITVPQGGTDLGAGLDIAANLFEAEAEQNESAKLAGRLLVVFTDGEDHEGGIDAAAMRLKASGVQTIVIGVGSALGEPIPLVDAEGNVLGYKKDRQGQTVMSKMSPGVLESVAQSTGGTFIDGTLRPDLGITDVESAVKALEKRELQSRVRTDRTPRTVWALWVALLALVAAVVLPLVAPARRRSGVENAMSTAERSAR